MDNATYVGLSRSRGLMRELNDIANNIANINTNGFRREGAIFAEHVKALEGGDPSLSMATMSRRYLDLSPGDIANTDNPFDFAVIGDGFFLVETDAGERLTRDGAFSVNAIGELVTGTGNRVLNQSGGAIVLPPQAEVITAAEDGTIFADGQPIDQLGVVTADPAFMVREGQNLFRAETGYEPVAETRVRQKALEGSNVSPVVEMARLIEVQRMYESSRQMTENEHERMRQTVRVLGQE
ncbi:MAG: flagellar hook-basal body complex protein [Hyphococcus sp.]